MQEFTAGYWFNFYNGPKGRFRQGFTYRTSGATCGRARVGTTNPGNGAHGDDNMIFTSLRYYLP